MLLLHGMYRNTEASDGDDTPEPGLGHSSPRQGQQQSSPGRGARNNKIKRQSELARQGCAKIVVSHLPAPDRPPHTKALSSQRKTSRAAPSSPHSELAHISCLNVGAGGAGGGGGGLPGGARRLAAGAARLHARFLCRASFCASGAAAAASRAAGRGASHGARLAAAPLPTLRTLHLYPHKGI